MRADCINSILFLAASGQTNRTAILVFTTRQTAWRYYICCKSVTFACSSFKHENSSNYSTTVTSGYQFEETCAIRGTVDRIKGDRKDGATERVGRKEEMGREKREKGGRKKKGIPVHPVIRQNLFYRTYIKQNEHCVCFDAPSMQEWFMHLYEK